MPPSGFSQPAINGLLIFVRDAYQNTLDRYKGRNISEQEILADSMVYLEGMVYQAAKDSLNGTISEEGLRGLTQFVTTNYRDLIAEIHSGKKKEGSALNAEIKDISEYLAKFSLH